MTDEQTYDVVILGAGPGGYVCAIRCAQLGLKTACVEIGEFDGRTQSLGGTCLNVGCIPSKALLDSTHHYAFMQNEAQEHGLQMSNLSMDVDKMQQRKQKVVKTLTQGIAGLFKKNKVLSYFGTAQFNQDGKVEVLQENNKTITLGAKNYVIATGSVPTAIPIAKVDQRYILDSTGALAMDAVPDHLGVIGSGVIGLEMGSVWSRLGSKVTVLEAMEEFLPSADKDIAKEAAKVLQQQGLNILLNSKVQSTEVRDNKVRVVYENGGEEKQLEVDRLLVAVGRKARTEELNLDTIDVDVDERGFIKVDSKWRTSAEHVFAIGDVIGGAMLAHKASEEGIAVAEQLAGQVGQVGYEAIPWVIYTWPEIAWAGPTEQSLREQDRSYRVGSFPYLALGRAHAAGATQGLFKMISDADSDQLLAVHIFGANASELIAEAVVAIEAQLSAEDLARTIHAHPTMAEGMHEVALATDDRAIHY